MDLHRQKQNKKLSRTP